MKPDLPLLSVHGLAKYYGERVGCSDVGFDLYPGEVLAVVGKSGSGKSTLLALLSTTLDPTAARSPIACATACCAMCTH